jgi:hypothetical protein
LKIREFEDLKMMGMDIKWKELILEFGGCKRELSNIRSGDSKTFNKV